MKRTVIIVAAALLLAGCGTIDLSNRVSCTVGKDKVLLTSMWQFFGITVEADKRDAKAILAGCAG